MDKYHFVSSRKNILLMFQLPFYCNEIQLTLYELKETINLSFFLINLQFLILNDIITGVCLHRGKVLLQREITLILLSAPCKMQI